MTDAPLQAAADAVRHLHHVHDTGNGSLECVEQDAADLVTRAVCAGTRHDQIAATAGVSGINVVRLIRDESARADAWCRERFLAEHYLVTVRDELHEEALRWFDSGVMDKKSVAAKFGISRPTLDAWIRERDEAAGLSPGE
ncbi:helix-turn-helix domain-containing protein [Saccharopolyspora tripterygii]